MSLGSCGRERELKELLDRGQWPGACSDELRTHAAGCRLCRELILVKQALGAERLQAVSEARLEAPGVLWWRAQLRRRNAAMERIGRPFLGAQIFALTVCLAAALVYVLTQARRGFDWWAWLGDLPRMLHLGALVPEALAKSPWEIWLTLSVAAMVALLGGAIVYMASGERQGSGIIDPSEQRALAGDPARGQGSDRRL
jgi:hypothetical protein